MSEKASGSKSWGIVAVIAGTIAGAAAIWSIGSFMWNRTSPPDETADSTSASPTVVQQSETEDSSSCHVVEAIVDEAIIECKSCDIDEVKIVPVHDQNQNNLGNQHCPNPNLDLQLIEQWKEEARIAFSNFNYTKALAFYDQVLAFESNNAQIYLNRARVYLKLNLHECVIGSAEVAFQMDESKPEALYLKALSCLALENYQDAYDTLKFMLQSRYIDKKQRIIVKKKLSECKKHLFALSQDGSSITALSVSPPPPSEEEIVIASPHRDQNKSQNRSRSRTLVDQRKKSYEFVLDELTRNVEQKEHAKAAHIRLLGELLGLSSSPSRDSNAWYEHSMMTEDSEPQLEIDIPEPLSDDYVSDSEPSHFDFQRGLKESMLTELRNRTSISEIPGETFP